MTRKIREHKCHDKVNKVTIECHDKVKKRTRVSDKENKVK